MSCDADRVPWRGMDHEYRIEGNHVPQRALVHRADPVVSHLRTERGGPRIEPLQPSPVFHCRAIRAHMQFGPHVEGHALGAPRLDDAHVPADDEGGERLHLIIAVKLVVVWGR